MSFAVFDSDVVLCSSENVITYNIINGVENVTVLPKLELKNNINLHNNIDIELHHTITNVSFSNDGEYFLICTNRKLLCLYKRKTRELVSSRSLIRAASKVKFSPNNDIVVADKSGDAYIFLTRKPQEDGTFLLGHLSMLLDILVTEDENYIITTDRDEKIRVSMYPNCYNITTYCLGHKKFVSNIAELSHDKNVLISSGGDGFLKFWDYKNGKEILSASYCKHVTETEIQKLNQSLRDCELEESVTILPAKHLTVTKLNDTTSILALSFYCSKTVLIYSISGSVQNNLKLTYLESISLMDEPLECTLNRNNLWVLTDQGLRVYEFNNNSFILNDKLNHNLEKLNELWKTLKDNVNKLTLFPILYKRKYDNMQEYQERKKTRLSKANG